MTHVRTIVRDLVERKLWPVALLLVAALVAVPVALGRGGETPPDPATLPTTVDKPSDAERASTAKVTLATTVPVDRERPGPVRNPFKAPKAKAAAGAAPVVTTPAPPVTGGAPDVSTPDVPTIPAPPSGGSGGGSGSPSSGSGKKDTATGSTYHVSLKFGTTGDQKTIRDIPRLAPLPSVTSPFFVFLGVLEDGRTAVFLVSSDATPTGDGTCRPSATNCERIELKADDTEFFDLTAPDGTVTQYQMDLLSVRKVRAQSEDAVRAAAARHSRVGAELLRDAAAHGSPAAAGARSYRYLPKRGVLVRAKRRKGAASAASDAMIPGAAEAVRLAPRRQQPGIPVWHWGGDKAER